MPKFLSRILLRSGSGLNEAAFILGISSLLSAFLALVRDRIFAHQFGACGILDIYYSAFRVPDLLFVSIASFVSVSVLIPILVKKMDQKDNRETVRFLSGVFTVFSVVMVAVCTVMFFLMPKLSFFFAPGFGDEARESYILVARILLASPFLLGLSNLVGSVTQSLGKFFAFALSPIFYNLGIIIGALFFYPEMGVAGLAYGVIFGAFMHLFIQVPFIVTDGYMPELFMGINWKEIRDVAWLSLPRTIGLSASQLSIIVLTALASTMKEGSISIFNFAFNLQSVPLSVIGISYSVAAFPELTRCAGNGDNKKFLSYFNSAKKQILLFSIPTIIFCIYFSREIISLILGTGQFNLEDVSATALAFSIFIFSVFAQSLILLFTRGFYAKGATKKPVLSNAIAAAITIILGFYLAKEYETIFVLPLAFSVGAIANASYLWYNFSRDFGREKDAS